jgi:hypothetical protein
MSSASIPRSASPRPASSRRSEGWASLFSSVTQAKAGVQGNKRALATPDPGVRQDDDESVVSLVGFFSQEGAISEN